MITITLNSPWYELMRDGIKTYEGRRLTEKTKGINIGDIIKVEHHVDKSLPCFYITIVDKMIFSTFEDALMMLNIKEVLPLENITLNQGVEIYRKYVSIETQHKDGVVMFKVRCINPLFACVA